MSEPHSNNAIKSQGGNGELRLVATPIGNLGDMTLRAIEALKSADIIACEDTRTSAVLLNHYGIGTRTVAYHEHNEAASTQGLLALLREGKTVALISDAGTPLLSDPGSRLVGAAREAGITVTAMPGASALLAALSIAGLPTEQFYYAGFLPTKTKEQQALLTRLAPLPATLVFYEAPHRLTDTLALLADALGDREAAVARELTKRHEECRRARLSELLAHYTATAPRGECVLLVHGATESAAMDDAAIDRALAESMARHSLKQAVEEVTTLSGRAKRDVYQRALALKQS